MNKDKNFILYQWNNETKEFYFLGHKIDYVHNPSEWQKYLNDLVTENKKLQQRIDKAIEYVNNNWDGGSYSDETLKNKVAELNITELLEILKCENNE